MEEEKGVGALILRTPRGRGASKGNRQRRGKNSTKAKCGSAQATLEKTMVNFDNGQRKMGH